MRDLQRQRARTDASSGPRWRQNYQLRHWRRVLTSSPWAVTLSCHLGESYGGKCPGIRECSGKIFRGIFFTGEICALGECRVELSGKNVRGNICRRDFSRGGVLGVFATKLLTLNPARGSSRNVYHGFGRELNLIFHSDISPILSSRNFYRGGGQKERNFA